MLSINAPRRECPMNRTKCWGTPPGCTPIHILTPGVFAALKPLRLLSGDAFSVMHRAGCHLPRVSAHVVRLALGYGLLGFQPEQAAAISQRGFHRGGRAAAISQRGFHHGWRAAAISQRGVHHGWRTAAISQRGFLREICIDEVHFLDISYSLLC